MNDLVELLSNVRMAPPESPSIAFLRAIREKKDSKVSLFLSHLYDGTFSNDRQAAKVLYNCEPSAKKYLNLKQRVRELLFEAIYLNKYELNNNANIDSRKDKLQKMIYIADMMYENRNAEIALNMYRYIFKECSSLHLYRLCLSIANNFRLLLVTYNKTKELDKTDETIHNYNALLKLETKLSDTLNEYFRIYYSGKDTVQYYSLYKKKLAPFKEMIDKIENPNAKLDILFLESLILSGSSKWNLLKSVYDQAFYIINQHPLLIYKEKKEKFGFYMLLYYFLRQDLERVENLLKTYNQEVYSVRHLTFVHFIRFSWLISKKEYQKSHDVLIRFMQDPEYKLLPQIMIEQSVIFYKLLSILCRLGLVPSYDAAIFNNAEKWLNEKIKIGKDYHKLKILFLKMIDALSMKNKEEASCYLEKIKEHLPAEDILNKPIKRYKTAVQGFSAFIEYLPNLSVALAAGDKIIFPLLITPANNYQMDDYEMIPYTEFWGFVKYAYREI